MREKIIKTLYSDQFIFNFWAYSLWLVVRIRLKPIVRKTFGEIELFCFVSYDKVSFNRKINL